MRTYTVSAVRRGSAGCAPVDPLVKFFAIIVFAYALNFFNT